MSVNPGFGGQKFIESQVDKIRRLKQMCMEKGVNPWIEVDGGVTPANAYKVIEAGANAIVSGSGVFGSKNYAEALAGIKVSLRALRRTHALHCPAHTFLRTGLQAARGRGAVSLSLELHAKKLERKTRSVAMVTTHRLVIHVRIKRGNADLT